MRQPGVYFEHNKRSEVVKETSPSLLSVRDPNPESPDCKSDTLQTILLRCLVMVLCQDYNKSQSLNERHNLIPT